MTNKEVIEQLKGIRSDYERDCKHSLFKEMLYRKDIEALDLAIKALEAKDRLLKLCEQCEEENGQTRIHINDVRLILAEGGRE